LNNYALISCNTFRELVEEIFKFLEWYCILNLTRKIDSGCFIAHLLELEKKYEFLLRANNKIIS